MVPARLTADERRTEVLAAAVTEFARSGYAGTSTEAIAARAGISQPYLFRLFGTKKDLFIATYELVAARIVAALSEAGRGLATEEALHAKGLAYLELMGDPEVLEVQMHGFAAAAGDAEIAAACRETFRRLWAMLAEQTDVDEERARQFFAFGMLISVMTATDMVSLPDPWAQELCPHPDKMELLAEAARAVDEHRRAKASDEAAAVAQESA